MARDKATVAICSEMQFLVACTLMVYTCYNLMNSSVADVLDRRETHGGSDDG